MLLILPDGYHSLARVLQALSGWEGSFDDQLAFPVEAGGHGLGVDPLGQAETLSEVP